MENMTGIFSSRIVAGQLFGEADTVIDLLLDCKLRVQEIKLPTTIHSIMGNLLRIMPYKFIKYERGLFSPHLGQAVSYH